MSLLLVPYHLDEPLGGLSLRELDGAGREIRMELPPGTPWQRMAALYDQVAASVSRDTSLSVVASGDCTTSLGILAGLQRKGLDPSIVWFDAHGDFNTDEITPSGYLGGMSLAVAVGRGDQTAPRALGLRSIAERRVLLLDARNLDPLERDALDGSEVRRLPVSALLPATLEAALLPPGPIYLHLDLDVLDPPELPGLRFPTPGGVVRADLMRAVAAVLETGRVASLGLGCAWWPDRLDAERAGAIVQQLLELPE